MKFATVVKIALICIAFLGLKTNLYSQNDIQSVKLSGVVLEGDGVYPLPYVNIVIKGTQQGTSSDVFGYFSLISQPGDTIIFTRIGYHSAQYAIPAEIEEEQFSLIQVLQLRTNILDEVKIFEWPSIEQFQNAFLEYESNIPQDYFSSWITSRDKSMEKAEKLENDSNISTEEFLKGYHVKVYNSDNLINNNLLNPLAWASFVKALQNGDFKP